MKQSLREHFDAVLDRVIADLPQQLQQLLEEVPLIVEDYPADDVLDAFDMEYRDELCGLHDGIPLTERSVEGGHVGMPDHILIYREGICSLAADDRGRIDDEELTKQIRITVLHEIGHHFGLDEDDLEKLGYG